MTCLIRRTILWEDAESFVEGVSIRFEGIQFLKAEGFPDMVEIVLAIAKDIVLQLGVSIAANWLYDKLKGRTNKLTIERAEVD